MSEIEIARRVLQYAKRSFLQHNASEESDLRLADPGFYLIAHGRTAFERELGSRTLEAPPSYACMSEPLYRVI